MDELARLLKISWLFARYRLDQLTGLVPPRLLPWPLRLLLFFNPLRLLPSPKQPLAFRLRLVLEALGPVFVKFGQMLSTRRDLLHEDFSDQLALLQDQMAAFTTDPSSLIEESLSLPVEAVFSSLDVKPIACASVAQVHQAKLLDGSAVVVKLLRPDIEAVIIRDLKLLHRLAWLVEKLRADGPRLHLRTIVEDYETIILGELDLLQEAANTIRLRRNFAHSESLYVPRVHMQYCRTNLLVMEQVSGVPIGQVERLKAAGTNMAVLAQRGVEIFFTQVFQHNFFHADMHPGNIFVDVTNPELPKYIALDCAIIGTLKSTHKDYLAHNLLAFFDRDYRRVAELHVESGWVAYDTDLDLFTQTIRELCEPIFQKPLSEISFGKMVVSLFRAARAFNMEVQPELVLLQKTLLNVEGLGRQLYPQLDLWKTGKPLLNKWLFDQIGPAQLMNNALTHSKDLLIALPTLPALLATADARLNRLDRGLVFQKSEIHKMAQRLRKQSSILKYFGFLLALLLAVLAAVTWKLWPYLPVFFFFG